ncbi:YqeG family HAD IIIA-type phosphatase [Agathobaculum sp.]|uniref:YqeG family HAD IIIA-type phosphatase n=1 Tax=Agathobaculum sp. TaxID=2048138 RepID=UPI002A83F1AB|nr:YqeG family HAD IIIA-type phosphatase [Agathobaculum sp.]MDY3619433.1 YqeG family HAD IIIA-type phosphatase [Agathobaculum sp.]
MKSLIPDYVFDSIYDITPDFLRRHGVRGVLIDLDGTMASHKAALPSEALTPFMRGMQAAGLKVLVFSNNNARRVGKFCEALGVPFISRAKKPFRRGFQAAAEKLGLETRQLAVVGDQIFTDVFGGHRANALTCYVQTLDRRFFWVNVRYQLERGFIDRGKKRMEASIRHE